MSDLEESRIEAQADEWMQRFARVDIRPPSLPDASALWVRAKLAQSMATAERANRPMTEAQIGAYLVVAAAWAALLMWKWTALVAWLRSFTPTHIILGAAGAETVTSLSLSFFLILIILGSVTLALAFHTILAEE